MNYGVIIPTLNRPALLKDCLASVARNAPQCIALPRNGTKPEPLPAVINAEIARHAHNFDFDAIGFISDHCRFKRGFEPEFRAAFEAHGPDCLYGLPFHNVKGAARACVWIAGIEWLHRFPALDPCCPDYWHFHFDSEMERYAVETSTFVALEVGVEIVHVNARNIGPDSTYHASRAYQQDDQLVYRFRQFLGVLWGRDAVTINDNAAWRGMMRR